MMTLYDFEIIAKNIVIEHLKNNNKNININDLYVVLLHGKSPYEECIVYTKKLNNLLFKITYEIKDSNNINIVLGVYNQTNIIKPLYGHYYDDKTENIILMNQNNEEYNIGNIIENMSEEEQRKVCKKINEWYSKN